MPTLGWVRTVAFQRCSKVNIHAGCSALNSSSAVETEDDCRSLTSFGMTRGESGDLTFRLRLGSEGSLCEIWWS